MNKKGESGSILLRILSDRNIQIGFTLLAVALILAFVGALPERVSSTEDGEVTQEGESFRAITQPYLPINSSMTFNYSEGESARIWFEDDEGDKIPLDERNEQYEIELGDGENHTQDLTELVTRPRTVHFNLTSGVLEYSHTITTETKPYGLLSFPALLFLLIGMVYAFKGKGVIAAEIKRKKMIEEEKEMKKKREEEKEEASDEKTIYPGEEKQEEGQHVDFMGMSDSSEDEEKEG